MRYIILIYNTFLILRNIKNVLNLSEEISGINNFKTKNNKQ